jgi:hypothetical protein
VTGFHVASVHSIAVLLAICDSRAQQTNHTRIMGSMG